MWRQERSGLFCLEAPLPGNPLKAINAWLLKGARRSLLVDNGFNMAVCLEAVEKALAELRVDRDRLDFFITHLHSDHNGLTSQLASPQSRIFCGLSDGRQINDFIMDGTLWISHMRDLGRHGFPEEQWDELARQHPGRVYASREPLDFTWVSDGDVLEYASMRLKVVATPGHTPGHMCLYAENEAYLISGDHILGTITPNITCWRGVEDSLGDYLASLDKIASLPVVKSYPGHRVVVEDTHKRIAELKAHHARRLGEATDIVRTRGTVRAWDVAAAMRWSLRGIWKDFAVAQKCFAVGEAVAHLDHLCALGKLEKVRDVRGDILYQLAVT